jgi:hypothetical protein
LEEYVTIKKKNIAKLASLSALGAGAAITAQNADAAIVYTVFSPPNNTIGFSAAPYFYVPQAAPGGYGGFVAGALSNFNTLFKASHTFSASNLLKIAILGFSGLKFQDAPGFGAMWIPSLGSVGSKILRSKRTFYKSTTTTKKYTPAQNGKSKTTTQYFHHLISSKSTILQDRQGDFFLLFKFNPTGSQTDYGWIHLNGLCNCGLDTVVVDLAYDDSGALVGAGVTPEPSTALPTGLAALALGATGLRRWRKSRKQAA